MYAFLYVNICKTMKSFKHEQTFILFINKKIFVLLKKILDDMS